MSPFFSKTLEAFLHRYYLLKAMFILERKCSQKKCIINPTLKNVEDTLARAFFSKYSSSAWGSKWGKITQKDLIIIFLHFTPTDTAGRSKVSTSGLESISFIYALKSRRLLLFPFLSIHLLPVLCPTIIFLLTLRLQE